MNKTTHTIIDLRGSTDTWVQKELHLIDRINTERLGGIERKIEAYVALEKKIKEHEQFKAQETKEGKPYIVRTYEILKVS